MANGHPAWCETDNDGVHRSRSWPTSRPGDRVIEVEAHLWQIDHAAGPLVGIGLCLTLGADREEWPLDLRQARVLRHVLARLLDRAKP